MPLDADNHTRGKHARQRRLSNKAAVVANLIVYRSDRSGWTSNRAVAAAGGVQGDCPRSPALAHCL